MIKKFMNWLWPKSPLMETMRVIHNPTPPIILDTSVWETIGVTDAEWVSETGAVLSPVIYYLQEDQYDNRRVLSYGSRAEAHMHYLVRIAPWKDGLTDFNNETKEFHPLIVQWEEWEDQNYPKPPDDPKPTKSALKTDGNVVYLPGQAPENEAENNPLNNPDDLS